MDHNFYRIAASAVVVFSFSAPALAGTSELGSSAFVEKAGQAGLAEVELGKVAIAKSQDKDVRAFADRMVTDHTKASTELGAIAKDAGMAAPSQLDAEHRRMVDDLSAKSGTDFDAEYSRHMAMDHAKAVELFRSAAESDSIDPALSEFAEHTLPTLESHKIMADELAASQQSSASAGAGDEGTGE